MSLNSVVLLGSAVRLSIFANVGIGRKGASDCTSYRAARLSRVIWITPGSVWSWSVVVALHEAPLLASHRSLRPLLRACLVGGAPSGGWRCLVVWRVVLCFAHIDVR